MALTKKQEQLQELLIYTQQQAPSLSPQCFLLEKAGQIQDSIEKDAIIVEDPDETLPVRQLGINLKSDSNLAYIQKITELETKNFKDYFDFSPDDIARMAHYIAVSEVYTTKTSGTPPNNSGESIERKAIMNTEDHLRDYSSQEMLKAKNSKRTGAGIQSVDVSFTGIDSFTRKQILLSAKFFFQDIKTMLSEPYSRLFVLEKSKGNDGAKAYRSIDFFIGWKSNDSKIKPLIEKLNLTIRTHLVNYSFDVRQDGSIVVDATYRGYYIEAFSGPQANLLEIAKTRFLELKERQDEITAKAIAIKRRNKKGFQESAFRQFLLGRFLSTLVNNIDTSGQTATGDPFKSVEEIDNFLNNVIIKAKANITNEISKTDEHQKILFKGKTLEGSLPPAEKKDKIKAKLKRRDVDKTLRSVVSSASLNDTDKQSIVDAGEGGRSKLLIHVQTEIQKRINTILKNKSVQESNVKNARETAFDLQLRLANLSKLKALQIIAEKLVSSDDINYALITREVVRNFKLASSSVSPEDIEKALDKLGTPSSFVKKKFKLSADKFDTEDVQVVPFVFLGKLLENILKIPAQYTKDPASGEWKPDYKNTVYDLMKRAGSDVKIDLGYLSYNTPYTGKRVQDLKLYYLPISLTELNNFFTRNVLSKGKIFYSFHDFINDLLRNFITGIFSTCSKQSNTKGLGSPNIGTTIGSLPEEGKRTTQYFIHGAKETINDLLKANINITNFGRYGSNMDGGIPHFFVFGKNKGIEKNIKLSDIADDNLKTNIYYSPRSSLKNDINGNEQLRKTGFIPAVFQADIQTIGFPLMNLGQLIYVDLKPTVDLKLAQSRPFEASGYYGVYKVSHTISRDDFSTNISAILQISDKDKQILRKPNFGIKGLGSGQKQGRFIGTTVKSKLSSAWDNAATTVNNSSSNQTSTPSGPAAPTAISVNNVSPPNNIADLKTFRHMVGLVAEGRFGDYTAKLDELKNPTLNSSGLVKALKPFTEAAPVASAGGAIKIVQGGLYWSDYFSSLTEGGLLIPIGMAPGVIPVGDISGSREKAAEALSDFQSIDSIINSLRQLQDDTLYPTDEKGEGVRTPHYIIITEDNNGVFNITLVNLKTGK